jgi:hypothetical protein
LMLLLPQYQTMSSAGMSADTAARSRCATLKI